MDKQLNARISPELYARIKSAQAGSKLTMNTLVEQLLEIGLNASLNGNVSTDSNCYVTQSDFESFRGEMLGKFKSLVEQLSQAKSQNLTEILESTLPKRVIDIEADSMPPVKPVATKPIKTPVKPPVRGGAKPVKTQNHTVSKGKGSQVANSDAEWLNHTQAFEYAKGKGFGKDCEVFRKMQYEPSAVEDYANLALLFDRDADPDRKRYRKLWKVIDA